MSAFLNRFSLRLVKICDHFSDTTYGYNYARVYCVLKRLKSDEKNTRRAPAEEEDEDDNPIKYTTSNAHRNWKAAYNFRIPEDEFPYPSYQWPVIATSLVSILIYFGCLREENDIDENLSKPLFERFPEFEKPMLEQSIRNYRMMGKDTIELEKRLKEISG